MYKKRAGSMLPAEQFLGTKTMELTPQIKEIYFNVMRFDSWMKLHWRSLVDMEKVLHAVLRYPDINGRHQDSFLGIATHLYIYDKDRFESMLHKVYQWNQDYYTALKLDNIDDDGSKIEQIKVIDTFEKYNKNASSEPIIVTEEKISSEPETDLKRCHSCKRWEVKDKTCSACGYVSEW